MQNLKHKVLTSFIPLTLLIIACSVSFNLSAKVIEISESKSHINATDYAEVLNDPSMNMTIDDILALQTPENSWMELNSHALVNCVNCAHWFRFDLMNRTDDDHIILYFPPQSVAAIAVYAKDSDSSGAVHTVQVGSNYTSKNFAPLKDIVYTLDMGKSQTKQIYVRIMKYGTKSFPIFLRKSSDFQSNVQWIHIITIIIYGILFMLLVFCFINLYIHKTLNIAYGVYILTLLNLYFCIDGLYNYFIDFDFTSQFSSYLRAWSFFFSMVAFSWFSYLFLEIKIRSYKTLIIAGNLAIILIVLISYSFTNNTVWSLYALPAGYVTQLLVMLCLNFCGLKSKGFTALNWAYGISYIPVLIGVISYILYIYNIWVFNIDFQSISLRLGIFFEVFFITVINLAHINGEKEKLRLHKEINAEVEETKNVIQDELENLDHLESSEKTTGKVYEFLNLLHSPALIINKDNKIEFLNLKFKELFKFVDLEEGGLPKLDTFIGSNSASRLRDEILTTLDSDYNHGEHVFKVDEENQHYNVSSQAFDHKEFGPHKIITMTYMRDTEMVNKRKRKLVITVMKLCIDIWQQEKSDDHEHPNVKLAKDSQLWGHNFSNNEGRSRARQLERYLRIESLQEIKKPKFATVVKTANFVLENCTKQQSLDELLKAKETLAAEI